MKPKYHISFSGGRTSAYMTFKLLSELSDAYDFIVTFANTGMEHQKTLDFVHNCDRFFGFNTVWLESVTHDGRVASTHTIVTYETASRKGEPYHEFIKKYGVPNVAFPQCTRELKVNPMRSYLESIGVYHRDIPTAIGIRVDESRRVAKDADTMNIQYPLIDRWPTTKPEILDWWEDQPFDLGIEEFEGNCLGCFKKSLRKHFLQIQKDPSCYNFYAMMEACYKDVGPQDGQRVFFRKNMDTIQLFEQYELAKDFIKAMPKDDPEANGGCSESCEVYPTA